MEYCLKNSGKEAVSVMGLVIVPKGESRPLTESELKKAWQDELPAGIHLVPILLESGIKSRREPATVSETEEAAGAKGRGRRRKEEE
jgi:hypothetical protein